jgi:hypothetical protein
MKKLLIGLLMAGVMIGPAVARELPDFVKDSSYTCDRDLIEPDVIALSETTASAIQEGVKIIYVKDSSEVSRTSTELLCRVSVAFSNSWQAHAYFRYIVRDGRLLSGFKNVQFDN